jgi:hypothetical protein
MLAVATSDLDPLPHQIQAVYGDLLGQARPLRFLLADDPARVRRSWRACIKELVLREDAARVLILTRDLIDATLPGENPFHETSPADRADEPSVAR